jgi:hypothetical protein
MSMRDRVASDENGLLPPLPQRLPPTVEARVGDIDLRKGWPVQNGINKLFEIQDFQRACQLYQWALPALGVMGLHRAHTASGATHTDWVLFDEGPARTGMLTPDPLFACVVAFPDLFETGPLVLEYSAGRIAGLVMDYWQRPVARFGYPGPEKGTSGGTLLLLGPGQPLPDEGAEFRVARCSTRIAVVEYLVLQQQEINRYLPHHRLYPLRERGQSPEPTVITARQATVQCQPRGLVYWQWLHEFIQREPVHERDILFLDMLRSLGIEPGKPFNPDDRMMRILEDAATLGEQMARLLVHHSRERARLYRADSSWEYAACLDPLERQNGCTRLDERTVFHYRSVASPLELAATPNGAACLTLCTYRDADGDVLEGSQPYRLHVPACDAGRQSWSLCVYDLDTRTLMSAHPVITGARPGPHELRPNSDGSIDLYFGPAPPDGTGLNWFETRPGRFWFPYLRVYMPGESILERQWALRDIEKVRSPLRGWWASVSQPVRRHIPGPRAVPGIRLP